MSEQNWTKEPWHVGPYYKSDIHSPHQRSDVDAIIRGNSMIPAERHDAARIVACVNAMAGIPDPRAFRNEVLSVLNGLMDGYTEAAKPGAYLDNFLPWLSRAQALQAMLVPPSQSETEVQG